MWLRGGAFLRLFRAYFLSAPSSLSLLLFKFVLVSISSGWLSLFFFLLLLEVGGTAAAGVVGVAVDVFGDAASACVADAGVAGTGVAGGSGAAANAAADDGGGS